MCSVIQELTTFSLHGALRLQYVSVAFPSPASKHMKKIERRIFSYFKIYSLKGKSIITITNCFTMEVNRVPYHKILGYGSKTLLQRRKLNIPDNGCKQVNPRTLYADALSFSSRAATLLPFLPVMYMIIFYCCNFDVCLIFYGTDFQITYSNVSTEIQHNKDSNDSNEATK